MTSASDSQAWVFCLELFINGIIRRPKRVDIWFIYRGPWETNSGACTVRDDSVTCFSGRSVSKRAFWAGTLLTEERDVPP